MKRLATNLTALMLSGFVSVCAAVPTPGNLLVAVNEDTSTSFRTHIAEYTLSGSPVQNMADIPAPGGTGRTFDQARDLLIGPDDSIYVFNGTSTPYLARFDPLLGQWSQRTFSGWSTAFVGGYGGLAQHGQFIYGTDMETFGPGQQPSGVVRFDTLGGSTIRFADNRQPLDLCVGPDQLLYVLDGGGNPREWVYVFDPENLSFVHSIHVASSDHRGIAVAGDGSILLADFAGQIRRYGSDGTFLDMLTVPGFLGDIDVDSLGRIAVGGSDSNVVVTDLLLDAFTVFNVASTPSQKIYLTWVEPVPEPAMASLFGIGILAIALNRRPAD